RLPLALHEDPALRAAGLAGLRPDRRRPRLPSLELLPDVDWHLGADVLGAPLGHLGARVRPAPRPEPRPARARDPDLPDGARPLPLRPVDGSLPRGVPPAR